MNLAESWRILGECMVPEVNCAPYPSRAVGVWHALFGNRARPLLLPAKHRRARRNGVRFFLPQLGRRLYAHFRLSAHDVLGERAHLPSLALPPSATPTLSDRLAVTEAPQLAFLIGTPGPYQKASMLVMSSRGDPLALVKIALGAEANEMVQTESTWLHILNTHSPINRHVPDLLCAGRAGNGSRYFAQSIVPGRPHYGAFTDAHAEFLRLLGQLDCCTSRLDAAPIYKCMQARFARLAPHLSANRRQLLHTTLEECARRLNDWRGPFVISHGDFAPWNMHAVDDRICVFDWEYANGGAPPLFDLLHFHLIGPASAGRAQQARNMKRALDAAQAFALLTYPAFKWTTDVVGTLGLAYLLHTLLFYGVSRNELPESHPVIRTYCKLLEERVAWLR